ncbi:hypothetical protein Ddye_023748 [Dipteronia dyeriana]|uniref:GDSL esterase/lipase n=1 Tax=Dipteronia dyeriana TaxID=168575 RepID=A0AAD9WTQ4_9ROSI|nr:hypothetical protein Ddye_023748 [Dipteronia dyeriana]
MLSAGTNDFILNYYDLPTRREQFNNISAYQDFLLTALQNYIKELYDQGCRQMVVAGLPPIGCLPIQLTARFNNPFDRKCLEYQNSDSQAYNQKLVKLLTTLQGTLPGSRIVYADVYETVIDMVKNPQNMVLQKQTEDAAGLGLWKLQAYVIQLLQHVGRIPSSYFGIASIQVKQPIRTSPKT